MFFFCYFMTFFLKHLFCIVFFYITYDWCFNPRTEKELYPIPDNPHKVFQIKLNHQFSLFFVIFFFSKRKILRHNISCISVLWHYNMICKLIQCKTPAEKRQVYWWQNITISLLLDSCISHNHRQENLFTTEIIYLKFMDGFFPI